MKVNNKKEIKVKMKHAALAVLLLASSAAGFGMNRQSGLMQPSVVRDLPAAHCPKFRPKLPIWGRDQVYVCIVPALPVPSVLSIA